MITYGDRAFCSKKDCPNKKCPRHQSHVPWDKLPEYMGVAMSDFAGKYSYCPAETKEEADGNAQ